MYGFRDLAPQVLDEITQRMSCACETMREREREVGQVELGFKFMPLWTEWSESRF